jgi:uncharacterized protein
MQRPLPGVFLTAEWRWLAMLNFEVESAVLAPRVPEGTELDASKGRTLVSVVGFRFLDTRVLGAAVPLHGDFDEVNLRFYVRRRAEEGWRRGVVFVRELVPRRALSWVARVVYGEPYRAVPMRHALDIAGGLVSYAWRWRGVWSSLNLSFRGEPRLPADGSEEEFITEHFWGYTARGAGGSNEYRVEHPRWRVWPAASASLECDVAALYGAEFAGALSGAPSSAFLAEGSAVSVRRAARLV